MSDEEKLRRILAEQLCLSYDEVRMDASFVEDLGTDSLDLTELIMAVEEGFSLKISDDDAAGMRKVEDLAAYIREHAG